jgi:hypothetical protein
MVASVPDLDAFVAIAHRIVWANLATVDVHGPVRASYTRSGNGRATG